MTKIKVCGLTNIEDAQACVELGVDFLGFVFAESPRRADPDTVRQIVNRLGANVKTVGVFTKETDDVLKIADFCSLDYIQLHGNQSKAFAEKIGWQRVIQVMKVSDSNESKPAEQFAEASYYLYDTYSKSAEGGTGLVWNWELVSGREDIARKAFIAGGLNPENVGMVISRLQPFAVDVSSGVEEKPGKKDLFKLERLVKNVIKCNSNA